jgi:hypothetical protein
MKPILFLFLLLACRFSCPAQPLDHQHMAFMNEHWRDIEHGPQAMEILLQRADEALLSQLVPFTRKTLLAASGDTHDYVSMGPYWWPDPSKPDGLPYIRRDGERNPESNRLDRVKISALNRAITSLACAWYFTGQEKYAAKAVLELNKWFLDPRTRMNPNMAYAQMIPGHDHGRGRAAGLIDGYGFIEITDCIALLENSESMTDETMRGLKQWFSDFAEWFMTSPTGRQEANSGNNHSIAYDVQLAAYAGFAGRVDVMNGVIDSFPARRLFRQIEPDGSQPRELERTIPMHYTLFNLDHMMDMDMLAWRVGKDVLDKRSADGRGFDKAIAFVAPYLGKPREAFPYPLISDWKDDQRKLYRTLRRSLNFRPDPALEEKVRDFQGEKGGEVDWRVLIRK